MSTKKQHLIQVFMHGYRYIAVETNGRVALSRDGDDLGTAKWEKDQLLLNTTLIPDDVCETLERKIKERMDANWDED
jgi:hypothetical protein